MRNNTGQKVDKIIWWSLKVIRRLWGRCVGISRRNNSSFKGVSIGLTDAQTGDIYGCELRLTSSVDFTHIVQQDAGNHGSVRSSATNTRHRQCVLGQPSARCEDGSKVHRQEPQVEDSKRRGGCVQNLGASVTPNEKKQRTRSVLCLPTRHAVINYVPKEGACSNGLPERVCSTHQNRGKDAAPT